LPSINYCSRDCVEKAHAERYKDKKATQMERLAEEFGDAGVIRRFCDRCNAPIHLCWKGREGEYCSNVCLKLAEKQQGETQVTEQNETPAAVTTPASPITSGSSKSAKKKSTPTAKKAAAKSAPVVKKAAPNATKKSVSKVDSGAQTLHLTGTPCEMRGKRADVMKLLKDGMTLAAFKTAVCKKFDSGNGLPLAVLKAAIAASIVTVK
jgi:hypothetical protein